MKKIISVFLFFIFNLTVQAGEPDAILGVWYADGGDTKLEVYKCEKKYCARVVWLKEPNYPADDEKGMAGKLKVDRENPDVSLKTRPIIGLKFIDGFSFDVTIEYQDEEDRDDPMWIDGTIYDPHIGKTYSSTMTLVSAKELDVRGYIGIPLFGRSVTWTR